MAHQALARKYRPRRFGEVTTQEHVSETLRRSVATDRVAHAYLFCGPRGVGKTTLARVLAMALNCPDRDQTGEPCGVCESCERVWGGHTALDVVEIDAASNRGVDDARNLRERAMYAPSTEDHFKVYIVDEAHMLTREAWNALLKILEEPPPRVIFVFATTEPQKIQQSAAPVLSRCQRFDFRRIGVTDIVQRLASVLDQENASAPEDALKLIGLKADGGMRDGLSLLDQVLSLTGGEITLEAVRRVLGLVEEERYLELLDILRDRRHGDVFSFVDSLLDEGYDLVEFYHGLVDVLRLLLRTRLAPEGGSMESPSDVRDALLERASDFSAGDLVRMLALASELESTGSLRRSTQPRLLVEMLLLRLSYLDRTVALEEILEQLGAETVVSGNEDDSGLLARGSEGHGSGERSTPSASPAPDVAKDSPQAAGGATPTGSDEGERSLPEAWQTLIRSGSGLPRGMALTLRTVRVEEVSGGVVGLALPAGPALDRLQGEPPVRHGLAKALGDLMGRKIELDIQLDESVAQSGPNGRITQESIREKRLEELTRQEPRLQRAVEELDLELLD